MLAPAYGAAGSRVLGTHGSTVLPRSGFPLLFLQPLLTHFVSLPLTPLAFCVCRSHSGSLYFVHFLHSSEFTLGPSFSSICVPRTSFIVTHISLLPTPNVISVPSSAL